MRTQHVNTGIILAVVTVLLIASPVVTIEEIVTASVRVW